MQGDKYSQADIGTAFGFLISALDQQAHGGDGDTGSSYPRSDAEDQSRGARFIPGEVTMARRAGKKVSFVTECTKNCWYWQMPDGSRIYHYDPQIAVAIGHMNKLEENKKDGSLNEAWPGPCPQCGNPNTAGGTVMS